ncbi:MAG: 7TM diverse intracellular signaling domain-containing protein [Oligoflexus sp.]
MSPYIQNFQNVAGKMLVFLWLYLLFLPTIFAANTPQIEVEDGVLDLRKLSKNELRIFELRGTWRFLFETFINPQDSSYFDHGHVHSVPGVWDLHKTPELGVKSDGYASYWVRILWPEGVDAEFFTLKIPELPSNYRLYVDGKLEIEKGKVDSDPAHSRVGRGLEFVKFKVQGDQTDIVFHTSSYFHREGGIWLAPSIGPADQLFHDFWLASVRDSIILGIMLIMSCYHFGIYLIRRKDMASLFYAGFFTLIWLRLAATSDVQYIRTWFEWVSSDWIKRAEYFSLTLGAAFFYSFFRQNFPKEFPKVVERLFWGIGFVLAAIVATQPQKTYGYVLLPCQLTILLAIFTSIYFLYKAVRQGRDGAKLSSIGFLIFTVTAINDILHSSRLIHTEYFIPFGVCCYALFQSLVVAKRFNQAFLKVEEGERTIRQLNTELEKHIFKLDEMVEDKTRDISLMLNTIKQGIFTIGIDGNISSEHSSFLNELLEKSDTELSKQNFYQFLDEHTSLTKEDISVIHSAIDVSLQSEEFNFHANSHCLPQRIYFNKNHEKILDIDWTPVIDEKSSAVIKVLVCLRDVTDLENLRETAAQKDLELNILLELLSNPLDMLENNIGLLLSLSQEILETFSPSTQQSCPEFFKILRDLHTIKGNARSLNFKSISAYAHQVEEIAKKPESWLSPELEKNLEHLREKIAEYHDIFIKKFGQAHSKSKVRVERNILQSLYHVLLDSRTSTPSTSSPYMNELIDCLERYIFNRFDALIESQKQNIDEIAKKLGKEIPHIHFIGDDLRIPEAYQELFIKVFVHLIRNALDHGLETKEERIAAGKSERGTLTIDVSHTKEKLVVKFYDDGRGFDLDKIAKKAGIPQETIYNHREILLGRVFQSGFSTKDEVSEISGRGVGLDAVKNYIKQAGGSMSLETQVPFDSSSPFLPIQFRIELPQQALKLEAAAESKVS